MHDVGVELDERAAEPVPALVADAAVRRAEVDPRRRGAGRPRAGAGRERDDVDADASAARAAASGCSGRCRRAPAAGAGRVAARPSVRIRRRAPRAAGSTRRARARSPATRTRRAGRGRGRRARIAVVSSVSTRSSAPAEPVVVGRLDEQRGVARDLGDRAGARRDDGHVGAHRLEQREAEALVDRRVREHRRRVEQRAAAGVVDVTREHDAVARVAAAGGRSRRRPRAGPGRRGPRSRAGGRDASRRATPNALDEVRQVLAGLERRDREHERGAADRRRRRRRGMRASSPSGGTPSGITTSRPALRSPGPNSSSISVATNSELVCTVAPRAIARRTSGTSARTSGVHSSG